MHTIIHLLAKNKINDTRVSSPYAFVHKRRSLHSQLINPPPHFDHVNYIHSHPHLKAYRTSIFRRERETKLSFTLRRIPAATRTAAVRRRDINTKGIWEAVVYSLGLPELLKFFIFVLAHAGMPPSSYQRLAARLKTTGDG